MSAASALGAVAGSTPPKTAPATAAGRRHSRRERTKNSSLSYRQVQAARRQAAQARQRRAAAMGRALPKERDPKDGMKVVSTGLVRRVARYIDADPELVGWLRERLARAHKRPGRPCELSLRTALICFALQAIHLKSMSIADMSALPEGMTWRIRRQLGIDYDRRGAPTTVSYDQYLAMFHRIAECFDAWDEKLIDHVDETAIRAERAEALQSFVDRLCAASTWRTPTWRGNAAVDATLKWSWERPPSSGLNGKIPRRGTDGDEGRPLSLTQVLGEDGDVDRALFASVEPGAVTAKAATKRTKRKASWPATWSLGAAWVGRANVAKAVHGYALHTVVRSDADGPNLVETFAVTPAQGDPPAAAMPLLARLYVRRSVDDTVLDAVDAGQARLLGEVVADPAYTSAGVEAWQLPLKKLGADPIGRLHRTNQDGPRYAKVGRGKRAGEVVTISGRPMCECVVHTSLAELRFPTFPYTTATLTAYQAQIVKLANFEWEPNGATRADGQRSYLSPHGGAVTNKTKTARTSSGGAAGGCELCVKPDLSPVMGADERPRARCCTTASRLIPAAVTALDMGMVHGSPEWWARWNPRNRVEGSYGVLKNLAIVNWGRDYHHFVGLARETLATAFAIVAYNDHMMRSWRAKRDLVEGVADDVAAMTVMTETRPGSDAVARRREAARPVKRRAKGPKGMPFLAPCDPDPPPAA